MLPNMNYELKGLVVGILGEASDDMHQLVECLALARGKYVAQSSGCATSAHEKSQIIGQIRRKLSTSFIRAISLSTLNRVSNSGSGSREGAKRREWAMREEMGMRRERRAYWNAFVGGGGNRVGRSNLFPG